MEKKGEKLKEPKTPEAVLADQFVVGRIVDIDQHVLVRMAGEILGEDFDEILLGVGIGT
jgi:hypothetical protein